MRRQRANDRRVCPVHLKDVFGFFDVGGFVPPQKGKLGNSRRG
jgi:hypothetical protein